jgi:peptide deformylase
MAIREIIKLPDPMLRQTSDPVHTVDAELRALIEDMFDTMYDAPGIGLAAVQIAVPKRLLVLDVSKGEAPPNPMAFLNPEIVWSSEALSTHEEGCLSIPEEFAEVERPAEIRVRFLDRDGAEGEMTADGLLATCLQHEIDHLNGVLFIDHLSRLKRGLIVKRAKKQAKLDTPSARPASRAKMGAA